MQRIREMRRTGDEPWVCAISVEEIWRGIRTDEESVARRLFRGVRVAPLGVAEGEVAGTWRRTFAERGITLHQADCLVAAAAGGIDADVATGNPSDYPMVGPRLRHWAAGA